MADFYVLSISTLWITHNVEEDTHPSKSCSSPQIFSLATFASSSVKTFFDLPCELYSFLVKSFTSFFAKGGNLAPAVVTALGDSVVAVESGELVCGSDGAGGGVGGGGGSAMYDAIFFRNNTDSFSGHNRSKMSVANTPGSAYI